MLTLDGLVNLVPELVEPAPLGLPIRNHILLEKSTTNLPNIEQYK